MTNKIRYVSLNGEVEHPGLPTIFAVRRYLKKAAAQVGWDGFRIKIGDKDITHHLYGRNALIGNHSISIDGFREIN